MKVKRIAIVTGATGGLGREFIRLLLKEKNMLFKMFEIDKIVEPTKEELDEIKEQNEE